MYSPLLSTQEIGGIIKYLALNQWHNLVDDKDIMLKEVYAPDGTENDNNIIGIRNKHSPFTINHKHTYCIQYQRKNKHV